MNDLIDDIELELEDENQKVEYMGSNWHSYLQSRISNLIYKYFDEKYISFAELSLNLHEPYIQPNEKASYIVKPDLSIYLDDVRPERKINLLTISKMPLCAIEILSPRQSFSELIEKAKCYFLNGVKSCWIVIPEVETIYVFNQSIENQETYTIKQTLKDEILNIEIQMTELFKFKI